MFERAKSLSHIGGRPPASLSAGLLARKGQASPAMRPQLGGGFAPHLGDDLGWNDMGHEPLPPLLHAVPASSDELPEIAEAPLPPVLAEREELVERIAEPQPLPVVVTEEPSLAAPRARAPRIVRAAPAAGKPHRAAFTLRLDADRHTKLRVAALLEHRSAQQLVTEALDRFLAAMPDVADLAERLPGREPPQP